MVITSGPKLVTSSTSRAANGAADSEPRDAKNTCMLFGPFRCESRSNGWAPQVSLIVMPAVGMIKHGANVKSVALCPALIVPEFELRGEVPVITACPPRFIGTSATPDALVVAVPPPL